MLVLAQSHFAGKTAPTELWQRELLADDVSRVRLKDRLLVEGVQGNADVFRRESQGWAARPWLANPKARQSYGWRANANYMRAK